MLNKPPKKGEKIVVGMSGGVDSSAALILLKKAGWQPVGVSLKLPVWENKCNKLRENLCCTQESLDIAKSVCQKAQAPYFVYDCQNDFQEKVVDYFVKEYAKLRTPNPCLVCNRQLKFKKLFEFAKKQNIKYVATGHYAKIKFNSKNKTWELRKGVDVKKDQTYNLSFLPYQYLSQIIFPLGDLEKTQVYKIVKKEGFDFFEKKKQSQDFCYVTGKSLPEFLLENVGSKIGSIKDLTGKTLGQHKGLHFYTLGQRKGIGLSGGPYYVQGFNVKKNELIVSQKNDSFVKSANLSSLNWLMPNKPKQSFQCVIVPRYHHQEIKGQVIFNGSKVSIELAKPALLTKGQYCVFYKKGVCLGSGSIG